MALIEGNSQSTRRAEQCISSRGDGKEAPMLQRKGRTRQNVNELISDLEPIDGVGIADVMLHQTILVCWDGAGVRHQLDSPPS